MFDKMEVPVENGSDSTSIEKRVPSEFRRFSLASNKSNFNDSFIFNRLKISEVNADTTALICLLQSVGFRLKKFNKVSSVNELKKSNSNNELVRVTIECEASGMRADLEYRNPQCTCPKEDTKASLWNVSGSGKFLTGSSSSINNLVADEKFIESGSNLLPSLDKQTASQLGDSMAQLIFRVNNHGKHARQDGELEEDGGQAAETSFGLKSNSDGSFQDLSWSTSITRCHNQSEFCVRDEVKDRRFSLNPSLAKIIKTQPSEEKTTPVLMRQSTFEFKDAIGEPRKSPPKISSSPVTVCSSLGQVSLPSDEEGADNFKISTLLGKASFYLQKAQKLYSVKYINDECSSIDFSNSAGDDVFLKARNLSRSSSISSRRSSPVTVRKKNQSDSKSPSVAKTLMKPQFRRSLSTCSTASQQSSKYSSLRKPTSVSSVLTGVSPRTLNTIKHLTTPKLPPRAVSTGTPSSTQKLALEFAKRKTLLETSTSSKLAAPGTRTLLRPPTTSGARIAVPVKSKISRPANLSASASTSTEANEEKKTHLPSYSQGLRKKNSMSIIERDLINSNPTSVKDDGKKSFGYSTTFGLKK
ncbi:GSCOCG00013023001-RA-CDS [Cotesia congregata]|nr:GSCOCG00013023001-RA-CDS [Cotesia congregata]